MLLQPDVRLTLTALALAAATAFVTLSLFAQASEEAAGRRRWGHALAALCGAAGLWAAHLIVILSHRGNFVAGATHPLFLATLAGSALVLFTGFSLASRSGRWHLPLGGAINGTGIGVMHYAGIYALAIPGTLEWDVPLMLISIGLGAGANSAALAILKRNKRAAEILAGATAVAIAFYALHALMPKGIRSIDPALEAAIPQHHWAMAVVIAGAAGAVLVLGYATILVERLSRRDNAQVLQQIVDAAIEGIVVVRNGEIVGANRRIAELSGISQRALIGKQVEHELFDRPVQLGDVREVSLGTATGAGIPVKVLHQQLVSGADIYAVHDLTERRAAEAELQRRNRVLQEREEDLRCRNLQFDAALRHMSQGLCMFDRDERIVLWNERFATIYGLSPDQVRPGMLRADVIALCTAEGVWAGSAPETCIRANGSPVGKFLHTVEELSDGRCIAVTQVPMAGGGWLSTHEDITEQRRAEARIEYLARHDDLTGLPNRSLLRDRLREALTRLKSGDGIAVHYLNLDRFKDVNDGLGHNSGDELLQAFASRLREVAGEKDTVARVGGDTFVIVQTGAAEAHDAVDLAAQIIAAMEEPFTLAGQVQVVLGTSIGISMAPGDGEEAELLLNNANLALSRAKQEERGRYRFFEKEMDARVRARHKMERDLRSALARGELELYYQPLLNLKRNELSCFEALLRWHTPDGKSIEPGEFIPLAEETGIILPLGEWALKQALAEAAKWPKQIRVAVNLSAVQFRARDLAQVVMEALAATGVEAARLELEITESVLLQDRETTLATLHQLRDLGVRIALDDFGTGFSSLNYLRSFPFDKLKIDRCFIQGLDEGNEEAVAIVRAVAKLGRSLGISTTAEGIETAGQMEVARREGFTEIQGYWLGVPMSAGAIAKEHDLYAGARTSRRREAAPAAGKQAAASEPGTRAKRPRRAQRVGAR
jgi:diguanylate cyclase (GGDEF)-like protein